jgi:protein-disulfide isomerase
VRIAFRHQPLAIHNHAREAAKAAMAAHAQGKFWEMHDKLFANQQRLDRASLDRYAGEIGLDLARYSRDMKSNKQEDLIDEDSWRGNRFGADTTPTLFINGQTVRGAYPFESLKPLIDAELRRADELLKQGTPLPKLYEAMLSSIEKKR